MIDHPNGAAAVLAARAGYSIYSVHYLAPRLERERARDGSCTNLSAQERNRKKLADASVCYVDHANRTIHCAPFVFRRLREALKQEGGSS